MSVIGRGLLRMIISATLLCADSASALIHRLYDPVRHDRFTGFPSNPVHNPSFAFDGSRYTGVGWIKNQWNRQVALVSPKHVVFAKHYGLSVGNVVQFLNMDNEIVESVIASVAVVPDDDGSDSDVIIATLQTAVKSLSGVTFFPYYRTDTPTSLRGLPLVVFGQTARVGRGVIDDMAEVDATAAGLGMFEAVWFRYDIAAGTDDDCYLNIGDSGSPSFYYTNSQATLIGLHAAVGADDEPATAYYNYDSFILPLVPMLNAMMETQGYHMQQANPLGTMLSVSIGASASLRREMCSGDVDLIVSNAVTNDANNVSMRLSFAAGRAPDTVAGAGWICEAVSATIWECRRGGLAKNSATTIACHWDELPAAGPLSVAVQFDSDETAPIMQNLSATIKPSYKAWAAATGAGLPGMDDDKDGYQNVQEYAFGSNPLQADQPLTLVRTGNQLVSSFPRRRDAEDRALLYQVDFSSDLAAWSTTTPAQTIVAIVERAAVHPDWMVGKITVPMDEAKRFFRVTVTLDE
jgi:hypothetical protein